MAKYWGLAVCFWVASALAADKMPLPAPVMLEPEQAYRVLTDEALSGKASRALFREGIFTPGFDFSNPADYRAYYLAKKDVRLFNFRMVALDVNEIQRYVGCCPNLSSSFVLVVEATADMDALQQFASQNACSVESRDVLDGLPDDMALLLTRRYKTKQFYALNCKYP